VVYTDKTKTQQMFIESIYVLFYVPPCIFYKFVLHVVIVS